MARLFVIFVSFCFAGLCVYGGYYGYQIQNTVQEITIDKPISAAQLLERIPRDLQEFQLTNFKSGKHFVPHDFDKDGNWDEVVVPMFPSKQSKLEKNYGAILIRFGNVKNKEELMTAIQAEKIPTRYWFEEQTIDGHSHNELAKRYPSMDFNKNVVLKSGFPGGSELGQTLLLASGFGVFICFLFGAWQAVGLITDGQGNSAAVQDDVVYEGVELVSTKHLGFGTDDGELKPLSD